MVIPSWSHKKTEYFLGFNTSKMFLLGSYNQSYVYFFVLLSPFSCYWLILQKDVVLVKYCSLAPLLHIYLRVGVTAN